MAFYGAGYGARGSCDNASRVLARANCYDRADRNCVDKAARNCRADARACNAARAAKNACQRQVNAANQNNSCFSYDISRDIHERIHKRRARNCANVYNDCAANANAVCAQNNNAARAAANCAQNYGANCAQNIAANNNAFAEASCREASGARGGFVNGAQCFPAVACAPRNSCSGPYSDFGVAGPVF